MLQNPSGNEETAMSLLSTYMLQGWVMTDEKCRVPDCIVPMMRSKDGSIRFCVTHDTLPTGSPNQDHEKKPENNEARENDNNQEPPIPNDQQQQQQQDEARIRREQSSRASQLIGQKLLQRWTLLNETCPNPTCYAIPLMRNPSKQIVCVICNRVYLPLEEEDEPVQPKRIKTDPIPPPQQIQPKTELSTPRPSSTPSFHAHAYTDPITEKLQELTSRVQASKDPIELKRLFESIQAGAVAIRACLETEGACRQTGL